MHKQIKISVLSRKLAAASFFLLLATNSYTSANGFQGGASDPLLVDVNGDGILDLVTTTGNQFKYHLATAPGVYSATETILTSNLALSSGTILGDFYGTGAADILKIGASGSGIGF